MATTRTFTSAVVYNTVALTESLVVGTDPTIGTLALSPAAGQKWLFDGTTGPLATKSYHATVTMSGGAATLDLTALADPDTGSNIDMSGLKLKMLHLSAPASNANTITVAPGASNGYTGWVGSSGYTLNASDQRGPSIHNAGIAVDGTHKTIDITGTGSQQVTIVALFG